MEEEIPAEVEEEEAQPEISAIKELDEHLEQSKVEEMPMLRADAPSEILEEEDADEEDALVAAIIEEESEEMEDELEEEEAWPDDYYEEIGVSQLESGTEPSFDMLLPVLLPAEDLEDGAARDPVRELREAQRA